MNTNTGRQEVVDLIQLIAVEDYDGFGKKLEVWLAGQEARSTPEAIQEAADFLHTALIEVRSRQAHYAGQLHQLSAVRAFSEPDSRSGRTSFDVMG